jgi:hypothetical protein
MLSPPFDKSNIVMRTWLEREMQLMKYVLSLLTVQVHQ